MIWKYAGWTMMGLAVVLTVVQLAVYGGQLPEKVASHFDGQGTANGWMSRGAFLGLVVGMQLGMSGLIALIAWALPRIPASMLNIPNRQYWLDEVRRESTIGINQKMLFLIGGITAMLLVVVFQLTINANILPTPNLSGPAIWITLGVYLTCIFGICGWLMWTFGRVPRND